MLPQIICVNAHKAISLRLNLSNQSNKMVFKHWEFNCSPLCKKEFTDTIRNFIRKHRYLILQQKLGGRQTKVVWLKRIGEDVKNRIHFDFKINDSFYFICLFTATFIMNKPSAICNSTCVLSYTVWMYWLNTELHFIYYSVYFSSRS